VRSACLLLQSRATFHTIRVIVRQPIPRACVLVCAASASLLGSMACSSESNSGSEQPGPAGSGANGGQITAEWKNFCVATFTRDYTVTDTFGDTQFTAQAGEEYLLTDLGPAGTGAELSYLVNGAPYSFIVEQVEAAWPFTSNCESGQTHYYAVFRDVTVFKDEAMTEKACDLRAGTFKPLDPTKVAGYAATDFSFAEETTYSLSLNAFASDCGDVDSGYIAVQQVEVLGTSTYLVPVITIVGPAL
jgi:hypothetical protein